MYFLYIGFVKVWVNKYHRIEQFVKLIFVITEKLKTTRGLFTLPTEK